MNNKQVNVGSISCYAQCNVQLYDDIIVLNICCRVVVIGR